MDFDLDGTVLVIGSGVWLVIVLMLWKFQIVDEGFSTTIKIILTIVMLPICILIVNHQANR